MNLVELLVVQERFKLTGLGLALSPDFSVSTGSWKNCQATVRIATPSGEEFETRAQFNVSHFLIHDISVPIDKRWRIVITLPDANKEQVPIGSRLLVPTDIRNAIIPTPTA